MKPQHVTKTVDEFSTFKRRVVPDSHQLQHTMFIPSMGSKRSNVMNTSRFITMGLWVVAAITLIAGLAPGQTVKNKGSYNNSSALSAASFQNYKTGASGGGGVLNNSGTVTIGTNFVNSSGTFLGSVQNHVGTVGGTIDVAGAYQNEDGYTYNSKATSIIKVGASGANPITNNTAARFATDTGKVVYKAASNQTVFAAVKSSKYGALDLTGGSSAVKSLGGSVTVEGLVTIAASTEFAVGSSNTLTLNAATPFANSGTFTANASGATTTYNNSSDQNVTGAAYYNLTISNGGTKTVSDGAATVSIAAGGTLTNGTGTFDLGTYDLTTTATSSVTNNSSGTIKTAGSVTFGAAHTIAGTFNYYKTTATQAIGTAIYSNLTLSGGTGATGKKIFPSGTVSASGTYTVGGADRDYGTNTGTFAYAGATASTNQTILSTESYYNLSITGASDTTFTTAGRKQANGNLSVANNFTIAANNVLDMQGNTTITVGGTGTNSGKIMWQGGNTYLAGGGVTEFYGTGTGTVAAGTGYGVLWFTGSGQKTVAGVVTAGPGSGSGTGVYIGSSGDLNVSGTLTVNGDLENDGSITNSGTITVQ